MHAAILTTVKEEREIRLAAFDNLLYLHSITLSPYIEPRYVPRNLGCVKQDLVKTTVGVLIGSGTNSVLAVCNFH